MTENFKRKILSTTYLIGTFFQMCNILLSIFLVMGMKFIVGNFCHHVPTAVKVYWVSYDILSSNGVLFAILFLFWSRWTWSLYKSLSSKIVTNSLHRKVVGYIVYFRFISYLCFLGFTFCSLYNFAVTSIGCGGCWC